MAARDSEEFAGDGEGQVRRGLGDLRGISRSPFIAYLQKQTRASGQKTFALAEPTYPRLALFLKNHLLSWLFEYLRNRLGRKHRFLTYRNLSRDNGIYWMKGDATGIRVALAGDWGTGTNEAAKVANLIAQFKPHYSIHLGDVYFVGDAAEVRENFLGMHNRKRHYAPCLWPSGSEGTFALNGNHEMYARGFGYFGLMLPRLGLMENGVAHGQGASFFCLENEHWRIVALDTGYNSLGWPLIEYLIKPDCALPAPLVAWLRDVVKLDEDRRCIVLLSHHQFFSRFDDWYSRPAERLAEFIHRPVIWFWGHEHRLVIYGDVRTGIGFDIFGRCIGHGGMPVELPPDNPKHPECPVEFIDTRHYPNSENLKLGMNGFARVMLAGATLQVDYVDIDGAVVYSERWTADNGVPKRAGA